MHVPDVTKGQENANRIRDGMNLRVAEIARRRENILIALYQGTCTGTVK